MPIKQIMHNYANYTKNSTLNLVEFHGWRHVQIVARLRRCPASHAVLSSLATCRGGRHFFMTGFLVSGGAPATARWKAAPLSLLVSEEALQGLDATTPFSRR